MKANRLALMMFLVTGLPAGAIAAHNDGDVGFQSVTDIRTNLARADVGASAAARPATPRTGTTCRFFGANPGLDVVLWTVPCDPPMDTGVTPRMCKVFDGNPGLDVVLWTVPCETLPSERRR